MPRRRLLNQPTPSQVEMKELGLRPAPWPLGRTLLAGLALTNVAATTLTLLSQ